MHPLIFLKEEVLDNYVKVQNNWIYQFLSEKEKKQYLQTRKPKYMEPSIKNYDKYLQEIIKKGELAETEGQELLSIQTFICNGVIKTGRQNVLINQWDDEEGKKINQKDLSFYQMIPVELWLRSRAREVPNVFFLVLFACSRDSYVQKSEDSKGSKNPAPSSNLVAARGEKGASSKI